MRVIKVNAIVGGPWNPKEDRHMWEIQHPCAQVDEEAIQQTLRLIERELRKLVDDPTQYVYTIGQGS